MSLSLEIMNMERDQTAGKRLPIRIKEEDFLQGGWYGYVQIGTEKCGSPLGGGNISPTGAADHRQCINPLVTMNPN